MSRPSDSLKDGKPFGVFKKTRWTAAELLAAQFDDPYIAFTIEHYTIRNEGGEHWGAMLCDNNGHILTHPEIEVLLDKLETFYRLVPPETIEQANANQIAYNERNRIQVQEAIAPPPPSGFVYLLKSGPYYKIGASGQVSERIKQLSTLPPFDIELIHTIYSHDMYGLEASLHTYYADKRKNGEWFELDDLEVEQIKGL